MGGNSSKRKANNTKSSTLALSKQESKNGIIVDKIIVSGLKTSGKTFLIEKILDYLTIPNFSDFKQHKLKEKKLDFIEMDKDNLIKGRNLIGIKGLVYVINRKDYLSLHYNLESLLNIVKQNCRFYIEIFVMRAFIFLAFLHAIPVLIVAINFKVTPPTDSFQSKTIFEEEFQAAYNQLFSMLSRNFGSHCQYFEMEATESSDDTTQQSHIIEQLLQKLSFGSQNDGKSNFEDKVKEERQEKDFQHYVQTMSQKNQLPHPVSPSSIFV